MARHSRHSDISKVMDCLASPERLKILECLVQAQGEINVSSLSDKTEMKQTTVSRHLRVLSDRGLVSLCKTGNYHHYLVDGALIERALQEVKAMLRIEDNTMPRQPLVAAGEAFV